MGPLIEPAAGKLLRGAHRASATARRGSSSRGSSTTPAGCGRRACATASRPGSEFHLTEYFGPVLGIMTRATLDEAIALQNATDYGLTGGHPLARPRRGRALDRRASRPATSTSTAASPARSCGASRSAAGSARAVGRRREGGRAQLPRDARRLGAGARRRRRSRCACTGCTSASRASSRPRRRSSTSSSSTACAPPRTATSAAWEEEFGVSRDVSELGVERNVFRYRPAEVLIRSPTTATMGDSCACSRPPPAPARSCASPTALELPERARQAVDAADPAGAHRGDRRRRPTRSSTSASGRAGRSSRCTTRTRSA